VRSIRIKRALVAGVALAVMAAMPAGATHGIPRDISIKYSSKKNKFKGKLKSQVADCRAGLVTLHRIEGGPNPIVGTTTAAGGNWSIRASSHGRYYADGESFQAAGGFCPDVRSKVLKI
jgi:hypothetical protein